MSAALATVAPTLAALSAINAEIFALKEAARAKRKEAVEPFLEALAKTGEVSVIVIRGYTPGFNDGEPCEHSASFWVNLEQLHGEDMLEYGDYDLAIGDEVVEQLTHNYHAIPGVDAKNVEVAASIGHVWEAPSADTMRAIEEVLFDTAEEENGTDYYVTYLLKDGKFVVTSGDYDCGY